ncbi:LIM and SH3 domain protein F42H10.3 isoform X2 [Belonocnema kinseyi]|uniref:LIM and SH3 domain protein F42H10.3 isoform X2 n=1 Tax=Belonocnema kinseyi TaxID=2817044 RepID=UPI00143D6CFB|nr:LIM and SH3 domain protein F42H10.3 isoform X2 [Belonocnema kinseyi]
MSKTCARCEKTVYPIEELKCLDKTWHKQCFKCQGCGMTLNMRTYKGFNKIPYCEAHVPKAKATTMAETPELKRIAENTKIQSNVKYHSEFEKAKGKFTQVADDPETLRIKQNSKIISNVAYHGELQKKAIMEQKRTMTGENGEQIEYVEYPDGTVTPTANSNPNANANVNANPVPPPTAHSPVQRAPGRIADYDPLSEARPSPYSATRQAATTVIYTSDKGAVTNLPVRKIGSVADIDPVNEYYGSLTPAMNNNHVSQNQAPPPAANTGRVYRAMYDYEAQDVDEVSFSDGDLIINCTAIDEGWMTGVVQRTGRHGMLPANYVEPAQI